MKKALIFSITALLALTLVGCSSSKKDEGVDVAADAAAEEAENGTEWIDTVYEEEATENLSEKIVEDAQEISELEEIAEDFETETAFSAEDVEKLEANVDKEILELESDIEVMESEEE